tara:strand:- start:45 stop:377 length:333 start_codon:yes stop_codon:yes gene_type:complete
MKKTTIAISSLLMMSFSSHCIYKQYQLSEALGTIQDMRTWMQEDINNDNIITDLGEFYIEKFNEVEDQIIQFTDANNIMTVDFECDGYEVKEDGTVVNFYNELQTKYDKK